jgi:CheY-like chemotaxis protein
VLVIEDDPDIRESLRLLLEDEGYQVLEAPDGVAGLAILQQSAQALVALVDCMMPRMNGVQMLGEVAKRERLARRHVYVLVTANYDRLPPGGAELVASLGARSVKKPFDLDVLLHAVAQACQA